MSILFWSVIAAAFIGPGTLVTASTAGAKFGLTLSWALAFATIACIIFQEMGARLTIVTGKDLAETLSGITGSRWLFLIPLGVILGCVAYEAGNLLGASVGLQELIGINKTWSIILIVVLASLPLVMSSLRWIATLLGGMVAVMGFAFLFVAVRLDVSVLDLAEHIMIPEIPPGAEWVALGLIGTTVVPYNLFLGSGISDLDSIGEMRFGITSSIILGGLVSLAILITGTIMTASGGLLELIEVSGSQLGADMQKIIAVGLFAAGFTSAVTSPLAAGLIVRGLFPDRSMPIVRGVSMSVLLIGALAGILDYTPEIIILAAQGVNGLILPLVTIVLWILTNDPERMKKHITPMWMNVLAFILMNVLLALGLRNMAGSMGGLFDFQINVSPWALLFLSVPVTLILGYYILKKRRST